MQLSPRLPMIFLFFFAAVIFSPATEMADQGWPSGLFIELQRELERDEYAPEALEQGPVAIKGSADPPFFFFSFRNGTMFAGQLE